LNFENFQVSLNDVPMLLMSCYYCKMESNLINKISCSNSLLLQTDRQTNVGLPCTYGRDFLPNWKNYLPYSLHKFRFTHLLRSQGDKISCSNKSVLMYWYVKRLNNFVITVTPYVLPALLAHEGNKSYSCRIFRTSFTLRMLLLKRYQQILLLFKEY